MGEQRAGLQFNEHWAGVPGSVSVHQPVEGLREQSEGWYREPDVWSAQKNDACENRTK